MTPLLVLLIMLTVMLTWFAVPLFLRRLQERRLRALCAYQRAIVLTYDDGPGGVLTEQLIGLLKRRNVRATFFMIGQKVRERPEYVARLLRHGHEIGGHTERHFNAWKVSPWRGITDMHAGQQTLAASGAQPHLFRPPFGKSTLGTLVGGLIARLQFSYWSVDTRDSWATPRTVSEVLTMLRSQQGGVVLMHDCDAPARALNPRMHPDRILALTEAIIDFAEKEDFFLLRFSDLYSIAPGQSARGNGHV